MWALGFDILIWALTLGLLEHWFRVQAWSCLLLAVWPGQIISPLWVHL